MIPIQRHWFVYSQGNVAGGAAEPATWRDPNAQLNYSAIPYTPGQVIIRHSSGTAGACSILNSGGQYVPGDYGPYLTLMEFVAPDGTETLLRDRKYDGQPQGPNIISCSQVANYSGTDRGPTFASTDGSGMVFVASADVLDSAMSSTTDGTYHRWHLIGFFLNAEFVSAGAPTDRTVLKAKLKDLLALKSANSLGKPWANMDFHFSADCTTARGQRKWQQS